MTQALKSLIKAFKLSSNLWIKVKLKQQIMQRIVLVYMILKEQDIMFYFCHESDFDYYEQLLNDWGLLSGKNERIIGV